MLDIDMPELDGMAALPLLLAKKPDLIVIMASTLTRRNAEISLKALSLGATDYIPKPDTNREVTTSTDVPPRADREDPPARPARQTLSQPARHRRPRYRACRAGGRSGRCRCAGLRAPRLRCMRRRTTSRCGRCR